MDGLTVGVEALATMTGVCVCLLTSGRIRKQKRDAGNACYLSLSLFSSDQDPGPGGVLPTFSVVLPLSFPLEMPSS